MCLTDFNPVEKTSCKAKSLGSGIGSASGLAVTGALKEEPADILNSLVNIKKEERENLSPSISPVGFGSIGMDNSNISGTASILFNRIR